MRLLYGTNNPAKLTMMRECLASLPIELIGPLECGCQLLDVEESGNNPLENARVKAAAYRNASGMHTLAADSGLYLDGISQEAQPGVYIRRVQGKRLSDEEMIEYYARLAASMGGRVVARYRNALCVATADNRIFERFDDSVASKPFYLVDRPHPDRTPGFPLDSISVEIKSGLYYNDLGQYRTMDDIAMRYGFLDFVLEVMNQ